ncbi:hypothetical protein BUALT_Bualt12G0067700 [Buddleja alternifolia]|uniref:Uncharacterized protein n=1 Tax=Buddleja alternifolia TaxID=168488 RepID=A0AAV6WXQ7_9LAMI|nr:hypothetical protein BUALT_Bualt12G0067700 [Buddleja alternifolia]
MASIAVFSILFPSIFFLLFSFSVQSLINHMADHVSLAEPSYQNLLKYLAILFIVQIAFILAFVTLSHFSGVATILVSATSYTGDILSLQDLFSSIKRKWKSPLTTTFNGSRQNMRYSLVIGVLVALAVLYPNFITISIAILFGIAAIVFSLYLAVVTILAIVVSVVEECSSGKEAQEKAAEIVEGQRSLGFLLNLFINLLFSIILLGYWMILGDRGILNVTIYGLFVVNMASLVKMFVLMAYTVLYFQCKKHHREETAILGKVQYTKLITDIPV